MTSPTTVVPVPQDLSAFVVQAYVPDDVPGGYRIIDAEHTASGFTIPAVPAGSYFLLVIAPGDPTPHFYQTASHAIDLGLIQLGRVDGPLPTSPTNLTFHLTGASPWQSGDRFFIDSFATFGESFAFAQIGQTALDGFVLDWRDTGAVLLNAAEGHDLFVVHQRRSLPSTPPAASSATTEISRAATAAHRLRGRGRVHVQRRAVGLPLLTSPGPLRPGTAAATCAASAARRPPPRWSGARRT